MTAIRDIDFSQCTDAQLMTYHEEYCSVFPKAVERLFFEDFGVNTKVVSNTVARGAESGLCDMQRCKVISFHQGALELRIKNSRAPRGEYYVSSSDQEGLVVNPKMCGDVNGLSWDAPRMWKDEPVRVPGFCNVLCQANGESMPIPIPTEGLVLCGLTMRVTSGGIEIEARTGFGMTALGIASINRREDEHDLFIERDFPGVLIIPIGDRLLFLRDYRGNLRFFCVEGKYFWDAEMQSGNVKKILNNSIGIEQVKLLGEVGHDVEELIDTHPLFLKIEIEGRIATDQDEIKVLGEEVFSSLIQCRGQDEGYDQCVKVSSLDGTVEKIHVTHEFYGKTREWVDVGEGYFTYKKKLRERGQKCIYIQDPYENYYDNHHRVRNREYEELWALARIMDDEFSKRTRKMIRQSMRRQGKVVGRQWYSKWNTINGKKPNHMIGVVLEVPINREDDQSEEICVYRSCKKRNGYRKVRHYGGLRAKDVLDHCTYPGD